MRDYTGSTMQTDNIPQIFCSEIGRTQLHCAYTCMGGAGRFHGEHMYVGIVSLADTAIDLSYP